MRFVDILQHKKPTAWIWSFGDGSDWFGCLKPNPNQVSVFSTPLVQCAMLCQEAWLTVCT